MRPGCATVCFERKQCTASMSTHYASICIPPCCVGPQGLTAQFSCSAAAKGRNTCALTGCICYVLYCSNTLELPDYAEALMATSPQLKEEWAAACKVHSTGSRLSAGATASKPIGGAVLAADLCPASVQECCKVLQDRLEVRGTWEGLVSARQVACPCMGSSRSP